MSSIWCASNETRLVWITLLALKDQKGFVRGVPSALANSARVGKESCLKALKELESPDPESSSKEFEGRRIKTVDGGWIILNHDKYQKMISELTERRRKARWAANNRERQKALAAQGIVVADKFEGAGSTAVVPERVVGLERKSP